MISLVLLFILQALVVGLSIQQLSENRIASRLTHDTESILAAIAFEMDGVVVDGTRVDPIFSRPFSGHYFVVNAPGQRIRSRSLWDQDLVLDPTPGVDRWHAPGPRDQDLLVVERTYVREGIPVTIAVGEDLTPLQGETSRVKMRYGLVWLASLMLLIAVQRWIVASTLRPLQGVREDMAALERGDVGQLRETVPGEVRPLVSAFNHLMSVMTQRVQRSRNAMGNLAHALKTPLTLLMQLADRPDVRALPEVARHLTQETDKIAHLMERELKRARMAGAATPGQRVAFADEIGPLAEALKRVYADKALRIDVVIPPGASFSGDREDLLELFGNLLDNACKWAAGRVLFEVADVTGLVVNVEDDGPGCADGELATLTARGVRADESAPGHGLGLAIAREVADSYGGTLTLGRSERLGGFLARVTLPSRPAATGPAA